MLSKNIYHLRDKYIGIPFLYFVLNNVGPNHYVLCKEIDEKDRFLFPFDRIKTAGKLEYLLHLLDKFFLVFFKINYKPINYLKGSLSQLQKSEKNIVLHAHMGQQGFYSLYLKKRLSCPLVVTFYGADMSSVPKLKGWLDKYKILFNNANFFVVEGPHMKSKLIELGCAKQKICVIKLLIPTNNIIFRKKQNPIIQDCEIKILMCANFYEKKGYVTALKTIKVLLQNNYKVRLNIIGSGPLERVILNLIDSLGIENIVHLHGKMNLNEIYSIASQSDIFFHPSQTAANGDTEGGAPTIISQMQAIGLPVVSTFHADIPNVIPFENYFLGTERNVESLFDQFKILLDTKDWDKIQVRGREFVEKNHSNTVIRKKYEDLYNKV